MRMQRVEMIEPYLPINLLSATYFFALKKDVIVLFSRHFPHNLGKVMELGTRWLQQRHP